MKIAIMAGSELSKSDEDVESDDDSINLNDSKDSLPASPKKGVFAVHGNNQKAMEILQKRVKSAMKSGNRGAISEILRDKN